MNLSRIYLISILLLAFGFGANSQEPPKAILVDAFDSIPCDELLGRTDAFFSELMKNPVDIGYAIVFSNAKNPKGYKAWITARIFDRKRFKLVMTSKQSSDAAQFWRVPPGSAPPEDEDLVETPHDITKPFVFGYADENNVCPSFAPDIYADLIKRHPGSYGRLIVHGNSWSSREALADDYVGILLKEHGLTRRQLRVSYVHTPNNFLTEAEFWFIPTKVK